MIRYLSHAEIDRLRWDHCISQSVNRLVYGFTWWLDDVSPGWDALVNDDYTAVMPLTWRKKAGILYLAQPLFSQQLGIFSTIEPGAETVHDFLAAIPKKFRYADIQLNWMNSSLHAGETFFHRTNFTINLSRSYSEIESTYRRNCRRNIQKAENAGFRAGTIAHVSDFIDFIGHNLENKVHNITTGMLPTMHSITGASIARGIAELKGVYNVKDELMAAGWFVYDSNRCIFIVCASSPAGKANQAMYYLVDQVLRDNAGKLEIFDFTGSNIPGIAYFNAGFGAEKSTYPAIKINRLPWYLRMVKH